MSFFGVGNPFSSPVGQKIEQATDGALSSENWALNMEICDMVNSSSDSAKDAIKAIRKRLVQSAGKNHTIVLYTLTVLETCVKNCGKQFHVLVCNKEFISELVKLIGPKNDPPAVVQEKVLSLIQCWADAFHSQPDLQGVVQVYNELKQKGIEFPMTDLDAMAPIFTPQRSVPDMVDGPTGSPQRDVSHSPARQPDVQPGLTSLSASQNSKLRADLSVVQSNLAVLADMLNELTAQPPAQHHASDIELLDELAATLKAMQTRIAELVARLSEHCELTGELLQVNDQLNNQLMRYARLTSNRKAAIGGTTPSAILGAAMGVPGLKAADTKANDDSLIDLSDDVPDVSKLNIKSDQASKSPGSSKDEFDMFAQSRNVTYENTKIGGSSYADNLEEQSATSLAAAIQRAPTHIPAPPSEMDQREIDEISAWLAQEKASSENAAHDSVTSSDFDKFLAERAAVADTLPPNEGQPLHTPRQRQIKKDDQDSMFAL